ncbi:MAG: hypothetical protein ACPH4G_08790 [Henriciella sp.]
MSQKPIIRTIHHLSCSGGSVVSKCIGAMPNTQIVSEIHPLRLRYDFIPFDPLQTFLTQTKLKNDINLIKKIFLRRLLSVHDLAQQLNLNVVLRDHTHTDYLRPNSTDKLRNRSSLLSIIKDHFQIKSVLTVRDPIDSYTSALEGKMLTFDMSFEDYCERFLMMYETYEQAGAEIFRYEDFCRTPDKILREICAALDLSYSDQYADKFHEVRMTGDSGRARRIKKIRPLKRRKMTDAFLDEVAASNAYKKIRQLLDY